MKSRQLGVTLIELMVGIAVVAILVTVAVPSFTTQIGKQKLKGAASELYSALQYARAEAVQRNTNVAVTFNTAASPWCYIVHTVVAGATCTCGTTGSCTGTAVNLKNVSGSDSSGVTMAYTTSATITFDPSQGILTSVSPAGTSTPGSITLTGVDGLQLENQVNLLGRARLCSPGGYIPEYASC